MMKFNRNPTFPHSMILFAFFIIVSGVSLMVAGQPLEYWLDFSRAATPLPWVHVPLTVHPLLFIAVVMAYLLCLGVLFKKLARPLALVLWITVCFVHSRRTFFSLSESLDGFISIDSNIAFPLEVGLFVLFAAILGAFLAHMLQMEQPAMSETQYYPEKTGHIVFLAAVSVSVIWLVALVFSLINDAKNDFSTGWRPVTTEHRPDAISSIKVAYDVKRQTAVLFGGEIWSGTIDDWIYSNETWEWDGTDWIQIFPESNPPARSKHSMVFDAERDVVVLFGGYNAESGDLFDVWEWDGEDWEEKRPSISPPVRCCHGAFYDPQRGRVVIYGGYSQGDRFLTDAWEWDGSEWTLIEPNGERPTFSGSDIAYFEAANYAIRMPNWIWVEDSWTIQSLEMVPSDRYHEKLVYDPIREQIVLFGGLRDGEVFDDTWLLTQAGWQQLELSLTPPARQGHVMFYDQVRERIVLFGGTGEGALNDMWELWLPELE